MQHNSEDVLPIRSGQESDLTEKHHDLLNPDKQATLVVKFSPGINGQDLPKPTSGFCPQQWSGASLLNECCIV